MLVAAAVGLGASSWSAEALAFDNAIGFGAALYSDSTERSDDAEPSIGNVQDGSIDMENDSLLNLQLWYLRTAPPPGKFRVLWGGGIAFYNDFAVVEVSEDNNDDEPETYGNLFQVYAEGDLAIPLTETGKFEFLLGGRMGPMVLFQSRDLQRELDDLSMQGVSVWPDAPRLGVFIGPHVGAMYAFAERIGVRFDLGVTFNWLQLYSGESDFVDGSTQSRSSTLTSTRYQGLLGLQIGF